MPAQPPMKREVPAATTPELAMGMQSMQSMRGNEGGMQPSLGAAGKQKPEDSDSGNV